MVNVKDDVELERIDNLIPYGNNPKQHPEDQIDKIASSIKNYGFDQPIVVDGENEIIKGHGRLEAAKKLGLEQVPVITQEDLSKAQAKAARLADNKTAESEWDEEMLSVELEELETEEIDLESTGFEDSEISEVLDSQQEAEEDDFVADVNENEEAEAKRGEIYKLGEHRLMCGDATEEEDVERLMDGKKADMVFTDPPYGVEYTGGTTEREVLKGDEAATLYTPCVNIADRFSTKDSCLYLWHAGPPAYDILQAIEQSNYIIRSQIIWNKNQAQYGALSAQYKQKHEPAYYCYKENETVNWNGPTNEVSVWEINRANKNEFHPTQKPVKLAARAIKNHSANLVLDLFGGSGSTLIATEQLDRKCYMMEIDPHYVDVIIDRWEEYTGESAELIKND